MPLLDAALDVRLGTSPTKVFAGGSQEWPIVHYGPGESLYPVAVTPGGPTDPNTFAVGNRIRFTAAGRVTAIRYWRHGGTTSRYVALWSDTGTLLSSTTSTGDVTTGWITVPIPVVYVAADQVVRVSYGHPGSAGGNSFAYTATAPVSTSPRIVWLSGVYSTPVASGGADDYPAFTITPNNYFADVVYERTIAGPPVFSPSDLAGLVVWLDAAQLVGADGAPVSAWPNLGSAAQPTIPGTPSPKLKTAALNGKSVVRFAGSEGRVRGVAPTLTTDFTASYVVRQWGPTVGRALTTTYPGSAAYNFLIGFHTSQQDWMFDNGNVNGGASWGAIPGPWKLYGADGRSSPAYLSRFFINGAQSGVDWAGGQGWGGLWNISGYAATEETCDIEVAEIVLYDRRLPDPDRVKVEGYLRTKWGLP